MVESPLFLSDGVLIEGSRGRDLLRLVIIAIEIKVPIAGDFYFQDDNRNGVITTKEDEGVGY